MIDVPQNGTFLFQGDSITDVMRQTGGQGMGFGYAMMMTALFRLRDPMRNVNFVNRGIGGNTVLDLEKRWQEDTLALRPNVLSILIGINGVWRRYDGGGGVPLAEFERAYRRILDWTRVKLPDCKIILMEPFVLPVKPGQEKWREDLDPKIDVVRKLARDFHAALIPLDGLFNAAATGQPPIFWTEDGVHPTLAGHALITEAMLKILR